MQTDKAVSNSYFGIVITLIVGSLLGLLTVLLVTVLNQVELMQHEWNKQSAWYVLLLPPALLLILLLRRNTLYFPHKVSQLLESPSATHWSHAMLPVNYFGTIISHMAGASVGREGALVLAGSGLARSMGLSWTYWGPVCATIGFASITSQYWVAPFFMYEMFGRTGLTQKVYALMGSLAAAIVCGVFQMPHLFQIPVFTDDSGFFAKLLFLFFFGLTAGVIMRFYKGINYFVSGRLQGFSVWLRVAFAAALAGLLFVPELRPYQGLGLMQLQELQVFEGSFLRAGLKLTFTLASTSLGFLGGEFIPLVYAGVHYGAAFFANYGFSAQMGAVFGAFVFFAAGTRFKWTSIVLLLGLIGIEWWFWAYFVMGAAVLFSGDKSLYKNYSQGV